jgi:pimeloyl-ACP methyl ester carboxylesterase
VSDTTPVALACDRLGPEGGRPVVWLHGFLGDRDNLRTPARQVAERLGRAAVLADLRNHGESPHADPIDSESMAADVGALLGGIGQSDLVGFSLGARVAMDTALRYPALVRRLVVVDLAPRSYPPVHRPILDALLALDLAKLTDRRSADAQIAEAIPDLGTRRFLLKSLQGRPGSWHWRFALQRLSDAYDGLHAPLPDRQYAGPTLVIRGERSPYVDDADEALYARWFPDLRIVRLSAGHWIHVEAAEAFVDEVAAFLA